MQQPPLDGPEPTSASRPGLVIGVLGGIASGKSAVARLLAGPPEQGAPVISADALAHEALEQPEIRAAILEAFGPEVLDPDGKLDRGRLAARVFRDPAQRAALEGWIHPFVRARICSELAQARERGAPRVVLDVPLLLENDPEHGLARACDVLVFVDVSAAERERRATRNRGWLPGEVARREAAQMPLEQKRQRADYVIPNEGPLETLEKRVHDVLQRIESSARPSPPQSEPGAEAP